VFPSRATFWVHDQWGAEVVIGHEELSYPFWTSGTVSLLALLDHFKIGAQFPFTGGQAVLGTVGNVLVPRRLEGTYGVNAHVDLGMVGGSALVGFHREDADGPYVQADTIYTLRLGAQVWYAQALRVGKDALRIKLGMGVQQVGTDQVQMDPGSGEQVVREIDKKRTTYSPYVRGEYVCESLSPRFGGSFQYMNEWTLGSVWLEVIRNVLRLELQGGLPALRPARPWESDYFVLVQIPITFSF
jgi:hypothetical protein